MTNNQNKDTNDIDVVKMAKEYAIQKKFTSLFANSKLFTDEQRIDSHAKMLSDFAQLHHREKMKEVIENMRVKKVDHYNAGGDFGINERDGYHLAICDLSDLTKTE